jgi:L-2-hydroxyglutarate oxidase
MRPAAGDAIMVHHDVAVIGAGVVGLSVSLHLARRSDLDVAVLEKEPHLGAHQSGRNSGVLHPGFNYEPGTLQAEFAVAGTQRTKRFCAAHDVPLAERGVVVIARTRSEERRLDALADQAAANGVTASVVDEGTLADIEPHAAGRAALHCPEAAAIDSEAYVHALADAARASGVTRYMNAEMTGITDRGKGHLLETGVGPVSCRYLVNAAGLGADRLARALDVGEGYRIVPFRGEYREVIADRRNLCQTMIYPTPDPELPFLGVHFTRGADDRVIVGPNAVLAFGREAYGRYEVDLRDLGETLGYRGFWRLLADPKMLRIAVSELEKTYRPEGFLAAARELVPALEGGDLRDSYAGIRAQVVSAEGELVNDPLFVDGPDSTHVLNAVSPGLTCSLPFGDHLADRVLERI